MTERVQKIAAAKAEREAYLAGIWEGMQARKKLLNDLATGVITLDEIKRQDIWLEIVDQLEAREFIQVDKALKEGDTDLVELILLDKNRSYSYLRSDMRESIFEYAERYGDPTVKRLTKLYKSSLDFEDSIDNAVRYGKQHAKQSFADMVRAYNDIKNALDEFEAAHPDPKKPRRGNALAS